MADHLLVSLPVFRLATEAVHRHSDVQQALCSLDEVIAACVELCSTIDTIDAQSIRDHLQAMPAEGTIRLKVMEGAATVPTGPARRRLEHSAGHRLSDAQFVSAVLFLFIVEDEARAVLDRLNVAEAEPPADVTRSATILPFR